MLTADELVESSKAGKLSVRMPSAGALAAYENRSPGLALSMKNLDNTVPAGRKIVWLCGAN
jgi:hypothetical protein